MKSFVEQSERHYVSVPRHHLWSRIYIILRVPVCQYMSMWMHLQVLVSANVCTCIHMCMSLQMYVWVFACISECHEYVSLCTTILLCLLSRLLSFARSLFPSSLLLSLLPFSLSLSHSILFLSTFLSVNLFHFLPLAISHVLTFHALLLSLSLSLSLSLFTLPIVKTFFRRNSVFQFSFDVQDVQDLFETRKDWLVTRGKIHGKIDGRTTGERLQNGGGRGGTIIKRESLSSSNVSPVRASTSSRAQFLPFFLFFFFCPSLHTLSALSSFIILTVLSLHLLSLSRIRSVSLAPPLSLLS